MPAEEFFASLEFNIETRLKEIDIEQLGSANCETWSMYKYHLLYHHCNFFSNHREESVNFNAHLFASAAM